MLKIAIDDGHGMETAGKRTPIFSDGTYMRENEFNNAVAQLLPDMFKKVGVDTIFVAPEDTDTALATRVSRANVAKADAYVSIHANAYGDGISFNDAQGIETWIYNLSDSNTYNLAKCVQDELVKLCGRRDRGIKESTSLYVLTQTNMPAILVECGFMTNLEEAKLLLSEDYRKRCAEAIFYGVCKHFNVDTSITDKQEEDEKEEEKMTEERYNTIEELPYGQDTISKLIEKGYLAGNENGLDLSKDMLRMFIVLDRAGLF